MSAQDETGSADKGVLRRELVDESKPAGSERLYDRKTGRLYGELIRVEDKWDYDKHEDGKIRYRGTYDSFKRALDTAEQDYKDEGGMD